MTPFGRQPVTAGLMKQVARMRDAQVLPVVNKWEVLRNLTTAANQFGVNRPALVVLQALLSFHKSAELGQGGLVVFPSNRVLASRAHGMPESTLRRNLSILIKSGLIARHDSPNGKRYAVRRGQDVTRAFGFDLSPLAMQAEQIALVAAKIERQAQETAELREEVMLLKRDQWKLLDYARQTGVSGPWEATERALVALQTYLRRNLTQTELKTLRDGLQEAVDNLAKTLVPSCVETKEMGACDDQNERHIQSSNKDKLESEHQTGHTANNQPKFTPAVSVDAIKQACPDILPYLNGDLHRDTDLIEVAQHLHPMMGITGETWQRTMQVMGREQAALTLACMLQKIGSIRNPGGYLRSLTKRAEEGNFSVWPMFRALLPSEIRAA